MMQDLISREQAIEVLERAKQNIRHNIERAIGRAICEILDEIENAIKQLPSTNCSEFPNNSDTISREAVSSWLKQYGQDVLHGKYKFSLMYVWKNLMDLPSAQPEIIRCGDCKWFQCNMRPDGYLPKGVEEFECRHWCGTCDPTDFCSYGERKTE